jgi:hypothetical protein
VVVVVAGVVVDSVAAAEGGTLHFAKPTVVTKWTVVNDIRMDWAMHTRAVVVIEKGMLFLPPPSNSHWAVVVVAVEAAEESRIPNLSVALEHPCSHSNEEEEERAASVVVVVVAASGIPV